MRRFLSLLTLLFSTSAFAEAPYPPHFREGANHHLGDDSFVAAFGRLPDPMDPEPLRMHTHLAYVRAWLGGRPAARPELAAARARLLGFLDEYIAHGTTPRNTRLPYRNPVFIDDDGTICAVGYLIERTAGRPLAEQIAAEHGHDYLETIAAAVPEVAAWIAASGFTLDELASIQPGYEAELTYYTPWDLKKDGAPPDGPYANEKQGWRGTIRHHLMEGEWTVTVDKKVVGRGEFKGGEGKWKSFFPDGKVMAEGEFAKNMPHGTWRFFHPSGNLAAEGKFTHGLRSGAWKFYYDTPTKTVISEGEFSKGWVAESKWKHYDEKGKLIATSETDRPGGWHGGQPFLLDVVPGPDGVKHQVHEKGSYADFSRVDAIISGKDKIFLYSYAPGVLDPDGHMYTRAASGGWQAQDCHFPAKLKEAARGDRLALFHKRFVDDQPDFEKCDAPQPVAAARGQKIDAMLASIKGVRAPAPQFLRDLLKVGGEGEFMPGGDGTDEEPSIYEQLIRDPMEEDLAKVLALSMVWYVEFPHVEKQFIRVFDTLPGYHQTQD
jgi:hypothetical protein